MRVVSFVNHLEFEFEGNVYQNAICLGDVDNDGQNELVVGNERGVLAVFKGEKPRPIHVINDLGMLTAVAIGDVCNFGRNVLVAITGCGICYVYEFESGSSSFSSSSFRDSSEGAAGVEPQPIHVQHLPANIKDVLIGDINNDGLTEMVVGLTDRVVRTYRWTNTGDVVGGKCKGKLVGLNKWELVNQIGNVSLSTCPDGTPSILAAQPGGTYFTLKARAHEERDQDPFDENNPQDVLTKMSVFYHGLASARLRNPQIQTQIVGNIKLDGYICEGETMASPRDPQTTGENEAGDSDPSDRSGFGSPPLSSGSNQGKFNADNDIETASHPPGTGLQDEDESAKTFVGFAVATLDGTLMLVHDSKILWNLQVDHQIFSIHALDVTQDGKEEVIACAWDGNTYIVCQNTDCVRFTFPHSVNTFTAGLYGLKGKQVPSLVYVTFNSRIHLYPDISMPHFVTTTVTEVLRKEPKYHRLLHKLGVDVDDKTALKEINHFLLYGKKE